MLVRLSVIFLLAATAISQSLSPFPDGYFYIRHNTSDIVLDVYESSKKDGASIVGNELKNIRPDSQLWKYEAPGFLVNKNSELLLEVPLLGTLIPGKSLRQGPQLVTVNQLWTYDLRDQRLMLFRDPRICVIISKNQFTNRNPILPKAVTTPCVLESEGQEWNLVKE